MAEELGSGRERWVQIMVLKRNIRRRFDFSTTRLFDDSGGQRAWRCQRLVGEQGMAGMQLVFLAAATMPLGNGSWSCQGYSPTWRSPFRVCVFAYPRPRLQASPELEMHFVKIFPELHETSQYVLHGPLVIFTDNWARNQGYEECVRSLGVFAQAAIANFRGAGHATAILTCPIERVSIA